MQDLCGCLECSDPISRPEILYFEPSKAEPCLPSKRLTRRGSGSNYNHGSKNGNRLEHREVNLILRFNDNATAFERRSEEMFEQKEISISSLAIPS